MKEDVKDQAEFPVETWKGILKFYSNIMDICIQEANKLLPCPDDVKEEEEVTKYNLYADGQYQRVTDKAKDSGHGLCQYRSMIAGKLFDRLILYASYVPLDEADQVPFEPQETTAEKVSNA